MQKKTTPCPVQIALEVLGGKWKVLILWHLRGGCRRFGELRRLIPSITQKMLTSQLRELEASGVVRRKVYAEVPPKVEYSLTAYGKTLEPILNSMCDWGVKHRRQVQSRQSAAASGADARRAEAPRAHS